MKIIDAPDELSQWSRIPDLNEQMGIGEIFRADLHRKMGTGNILIVMDTSGSMSEEDIRMGLTEFKGMCENNRIRVTASFPQIRKLVTKSSLNQKICWNSLVPCPSRVIEGYRYVDTCGTRNLCSRPSI